MRSCVRKNQRKPGQDRQRCEKENKLKGDSTFWRNSRTLRTYRVSRTAPLGTKRKIQWARLIKTNAHPIRTDTIFHNCAASANSNDVPTRTQAHARDQKKVRKRGPVSLRIAKTHTEMSISDRLRITFAALMEDSCHRREDHDDHFLHPPCPVQRRSPRIIRT